MAFLFLSGTIFTTTIVSQKTIWCDKKNYFVSWCFESNQPQRITSGLKKMKKEDEEENKTRFLMHVVFVLSSNRFATIFITNCHASIFFIFFYQSGQGYSKASNQKEQVMISTSGSRLRWYVINLFICMCLAARDWLNPRLKRVLKLSILEGATKK